jgi:DNA-binding response OmpR family regulator
MAKILIVEDELDLAGPVRDWLARESNTVEIVADGSEALECLRLYKYDVIILDLMLPGLNGMEICRQFRARGGTTPILMLTAKGSVEDKEAGLDIGADDYLTKPFSLKELAARVRALLRRPPDVSSNILTVADIALDPSANNVTKAGKEIHLLPKEFSLLEFFMRHPNQVFSAEALIDRVWQSDSDALSDTIRTHIKTLRRKIDSKGKPSLIATVHGVGYKLESPGEAANV